MWLVMFLGAVTGSSKASDVANSASQTGVFCTDAWYKFIEESVSTDDGRGHGPDIGSDEWKSAVEFKLGIQGKSDLPRRDSDAWCRHIDQLVSINHTSSGERGDTDKEVKVPVPSFDCGRVRAGSIEATICDDEGLSSLDRKLADVYAAALKKAENQRPFLLKAEQRGWIKGRNECWKAADRRECIRNEYERRIAELQARYRLVSDSGPTSFICDGNPANEVAVTFFRTDPSTLIAEHGDRSSLMYLQPSGSGSKYQGRNETFWEHQGQALISLGISASEMKCVRTPCETSCP
jgi:uncharacterized protein